jgi:hypothetical protein
MRGSKTVELQDEEINMDYLGEKRFGLLKPNALKIFKISFQDIS